MGRMTIIVSVLSWMVLAGSSMAEESPFPPVSEQKPLSGPMNVEAIVQKVQEAAKSLKGYECQIDYVLRQPLLESQTRRKGRIYYLRSPTSSRLRVNFETLQQDDQSPQSYIEQFLFDGVWLTHVDYQVKAVKKRQMADPNKPVDAFDLAGKDLPIVGFTGMEDLRQDFDMEVVPIRPGQSADKVVCLSLKAKPGSRRGQEYRTIVFDVDKRLWLPVQVKAESTEGDIYDISFIQPQVNPSLEEAVFDLKAPKEFGDPEILPLETRKETDPTHVP
jgi:outer membrane lipoprotein-sorting protein